jgi:cytochrome c553
MPRSLGGCDHPDCIVRLCRRCHRAYDRGELDLLPHLEPRYRAELAHALTHLSLLGVLQRATGQRWRALEGGRKAA